MIKTVTTELGGRTLTFETGKMAKQANGSVVVSTGSGSAVLTNAPWIVPGDTLRISGPTNASFEVQGSAW